MDAYVQQNTSFYSTWNPDTIEKTLKEHLANVMEANPNVSKNKYKTKFEYESTEVTW